MTPRDFQTIKEKIESAKEQKARAEGAIGKIEEQWKKEFDVNSLEEAEQKAEEMEKEIADDKKQLDIMYGKLEKIVEWDSI